MTLVTTRFWLCKEQAWYPQSSCSGVEIMLSLHWPLALFHMYSVVDKHAFSHYAQSYPHV